MSLHGLNRRPLDQAELRQSWNEIDRPQNDCGAAIMASALVEDSLARALDKRSNFATLIEAGYTRGLYKGLVRNDLHVIRKVRNLFGHATRAITFETPEVVEEIGKFQFLRCLQVTGGLTFGSRNLPSVHRETYTNICQALVNELCIASAFAGIVLDFPQSFRPDSQAIR